MLHKCYLLSFAAALYKFLFIYYYYYYYYYKAGFDKSLPSSYRPISNLNNISKLLERLILIRIRDHISPEGIQFWLCVLKLRCIRGTTSHDLTESFHLIKMSPSAAVCCPPTVRRFSCN